MPPTVRPTGVSFGGHLVESLLRSLAGSAEPPGSLQLTLQWQAPASAYAPPPMPAPTPLPPIRSWWPVNPSPRPPLAASLTGTTAPLLPSAPILPLAANPVLAVDRGTTSSSPLPAPPTAGRPAEALHLQSQLPVLAADGRRLTATLTLTLLPKLRHEHPAMAAQLETALSHQALPLLRSDSAVEALAGQCLQFQWTDPRALWPLQSLAMRGLLRFATLAEERDRERERQRARRQALREETRERAPLPTPAPLPAADGGPPRIGVAAWLTLSARTFLDWLRRQRRG